MFSTLEGKDEYWMSMELIVGGELFEHLVEQVSQKRWVGGLMRTNISFLPAGFRGHILKQRPQYFYGNSWKQFHSCTKPDASLLSGASKLNLCFTDSWLT
jgi:hypothetical protein